MDQHNYHCLYFTKCLITNLFTMYFEALSLISSNALLKFLKEIHELNHAV